MENIPNTAVPTSKLRWLWLALARIVLVLFALGGYLAVTSLPALYSPPDRVRSSTDYDKKMNPTRVREITAKAPPTNQVPVISVTTNQLGLVRLEYPYQRMASTEAMVFTLHRLNPGDKVQLGELNVELKRIAHLWVPPSTNQNIKALSSLAQFYSADLQPISDMEVARELPRQRDRTMESSRTRPAYRFDLAVVGGPWKFAGAKLYDARTQKDVNAGWSSQQIYGTNLMLGMNPYLWHATPVELVVDMLTGPMEEEELRPVVGESFTVGKSRYQLIYTADKLVQSYSLGDDSRIEYVQFNSPAGQTGQKSFLLFKITPPAILSYFQIEYLDANGKVIEAVDGEWAGSKLVANLQHKLADIKAIRVRKYRSGNRLVFQLPSLPGLPRENRQVDNLFKVRAPVLRFDESWKQADYVRRITQLETPLISVSLPPGTYPRWFTNATPAEVLEDYGKVMSVKEDFHVNQEKLVLEVGKRSWPVEALGKVRDFWKKIKGP